MYKNGSIVATTEGNSHCGCIDQETILSKVKGTSNESVKSIKQKQAKDIINQEMANQNNHKLNRHYVYPYFRMKANEKIESLYD